MPEPTTAELLGIGEGYAVWLVGGSLETDSLLDPLPEGAFVIEAPEGDDDSSESVDAAVLVADGQADLRRLLDDTLSELGSVEPVWVVYPDDGYGTMTPEDVYDVLDDFAWAAYEHHRLGGAWSAMRIAQL
ncbi:DUF3052 family protein [Aeromicrobium massiliense]|uniref:DUF3052 family protein n=1 Tax=Aeromicrobium massiliense TaxID=1464554 RepID=UPI0005781B7B|nr:DUF3052 family protein [Aeromicrobium massiliense]